MYSTCSLNPVEDEAVVHRMLLEAGPANVALEDATSLVPGLRFTPGLNKWKVGSKDGDIFEKWEDVPEHLHNQIRPYMFPSDGIDCLNLDRCIRVLPHQQDTGGFFVAVLTKKNLCDWESKSKQTEAASNEADGKTDSSNKKQGLYEPPRKKARRHQGYKEDPYIYFDEDEPTFAKIKEYYGLTVNT